MCTLVIIATIGPASETQDTIKDLILSGVNIFRFNMKHNTAEWHMERIDRVQKVSDALKISIGILIDLQGPEIRIETNDQKDIPVKEGDTVQFCSSYDQVPNKDCVRIAHETVLESLATARIPTGTYC
jgi:pyruvate kinase